MDVRSIQKLTRIKIGFLQNYLSGNAPAFASGTIHTPLSVSGDSPLDLALDKMGLRSQQVVEDRSIA